MLLETIAQAIKKSGKSRYRIAQDTGIDQTVLHRIINGGSCSAETIDLLCKYLGLELVPKSSVKRSRKKRKKKGKVTL